MSRLLDALIYGYRTVKAAGTAVTQRDTLNFVDHTVADNPGQSRTDVSLPGAGCPPAITVPDANKALVVNAGGTAMGWATILNANVNAAAAIAGTKVAPDFGAQTITTTGNLTLTAAGRVVLGATPATTGRIGLTAADSITWKVTAGDAPTLSVAADGTAQLGGTNSTAFHYDSASHGFRSAAGAAAVTIAGAAGVVTWAVGASLALQQTVNGGAAGSTSQWLAQSSTFGVGALHESVAGSSTVGAGGNLKHQAGAGNVAGAAGYCFHLGRLHQFWDQPGANQSAEFYYSTESHLDFKGSHAQINMGAGSPMILATTSLYLSAPYVNIKSNYLQFDDGYTPFIQIKAQAAAGALLSIVGEESTGSNGGPVGVIGGKSTGGNGNGADSYLQAGLKNGVGSTGSARLKDAEAHTVIEVKGEGAAPSYLGFYGVAPVARPAHIADATNAADVITRANAIILALEQLGLLNTA